MYTFFIAFGGLFAIIGLLGITSGMDDYSFVFSIGVVALLVGLIWKYIAEGKKENTSATPNTTISPKPQPKIKTEQEINIAYTLLVSHYMKLAEDLASNMEEEDKKHFEEKFPALLIAISDLISQKEKVHGTIFLTEDAETNATAKCINQQIGKEAYAITFYYLLNFDEELKLFSRNEIVEAILYALEQPDLDDEQMIHTIFNRLGI